MALTASPRSGLEVGSSWRRTAGRSRSRLTARLTTCPTRPAGRGRLWRWSPRWSDERQYYVQEYPKTGREDKDNEDQFTIPVYAEVFAQPRKPPDFRSVVPDMSLVVLFTRSPSVNNYNTGAKRPSSG